MKNFILSNWPSILIIAAFLIYTVILVVKGKWEQLRSMGYRMILQAERVITGTKKGQERFETVFAQVYSLIPAWLRFFISEQSLREKLQEWYNHIKDYMDNGTIDNSQR
jgi:hypothetical protein